MEHVEDRYPSLVHESDRRLDDPAQVPDERGVDPSVELAAQERRVAVPRRATGAGGARRRARAELAPDLDPADLSAEAGRCVRRAPQVSTVTA